MAQSAPPSEPAAENDLARQLAEAEKRNAELETAVRLLSQKLDQSGSVLAAKYQEVVEARYQHYIDLLAHRRAVFRWQLIASYVVLGIVALVTISGLVFSAAQLVVLTLSIVFLFLFLDRIYEIREIGGAPIAEQAPAAEPAPASE